MTASVGCARRAEFDLGVDHDAAQRLDRILHQRTRLDGLQRQLVIGALHAGQCEQILGQPVHAARVLVDDAQKLARGLGVRVRVLHQRLHVALDRCERRAQLMAHVGNEIAARFLRSLDARHIVQHGNRAARRQWSRIDLEDASRRERTGAAEAHFPVVAARRERRPAARDRARSGSRGRPARICVPAMRCITAFDQRTCPSGVMATTASCMESSMVASSWRRLSISAKLWPSRSAVWFSALSIAASSSPPATSRRALRSPWAMRRAKATTRCNRAVTPLAAHAANGKATASAISPDQSASRSRK